MAKKPENDVNTVISFPQTQAERNKMRNRAEFGDKIRAYRKACALSVHRARIFHFDTRIFFIFSFGQIERH